MADTQASITGVRQIALHVRDLDTAKAFYGDVLGLPHLFDAPPGMAFYDCGGVRIMLGQAETGAPPGPTIVYYAVEDIQAAAAGLEARGAVIERAPHLVAKLPTAEVWLAFLKDPDGSPVALMSEVPVG